MTDEKKTLKMIDEKKNIHNFHTSLCFTFIEFFQFLIQNATNCLSKGGASALTRNC